MEDYTNYTNILSTEEKALLENLINKLAAVSGLRQYNTQAATILFKNWIDITNNTLDEAATINSPNIYTVNSIQDIKEGLKCLDDYVMEMQDMLKSKPIITNLEKIRQYIDIINEKLSDLK